MNLTNVTNVVNMDSYNPNGEWKIVGTVGERHEFSYSCCPNEKFSFLSFKIFMRRSVSAGSQRYLI
jgi:hypothetical protein